MVQYVVIFWNQIDVGAMNKILDYIYRMFVKEMRDLEFGHMLQDKDICDMWEAIHAYEMLDSNTLSSKEQKQIIEYYD